MTWRALAITVMLAGVAHAEPTTAQQHQRRGSTAYDLGDYDAAIEEFKAGYELTNAPGFLYNLGQAYRLHHDCAAAERSYRAYLRADPKANRTVIDARIDEMVACQAAQLPNVDREVVPPIAIPAEPIPERPTYDTGSHWMRGAGWTALAVGAASAGIATWATLESRSANQHVDEVVAKGALWTPADQAILDHGRHMRTTAIVAWSGAAVTVAGGCALLWFGRDRPVQITATPKLAAIAVAGRF